MGTMCAMYGWPVEASAEPIEPSSRSLRVTAFMRRVPLLEGLTALIVRTAGVSTPVVCEAMPSILQSHAVILKVQPKNPRISLRRTGELAGADAEYGDSSPSG